LFMDELFTFFKRHLAALTLVITLSVCAALIAFGDGVRGTDQYWYLADTQTLAAGEAPTTNTVFPGVVLRNQNGFEETYFAHNGPVLHINALLAKSLGPFVAWKYSNIVFLLLAAVFTGLTVGRLAGTQWGYAACIVYMVTPINLWLAGNVLQETFFAFLSAVIIYLIVVGDKAAMPRAFLLPLLVVGCASHPLFLVVGLCFSIYSAVVNRTFAYAIMVLLVVVLTTALKGYVFPSSFPPSMRDLVASSVPGVSNTIWLMSNVVPQIDVAFMVNKLGHALSVQFLPSSLTPIYLVSNLGLIGFICLAFRFSKRMRPVMFCAAVWMLAYAAMVVLMQNQMRYQLLIIPASVICCVLWLSQWSRQRLAVIGLIVLVTAYIPVDYLMLTRIQTESLSERQALLQVSRKLDFIEKSDRIAVVGNNTGGWLSLIATMRHNKTLLVSRNLLQDDTFSEAVMLFEPDYIFTRDGLTLDEIPNAEFIKRHVFDDFQNLDIYRINQL
jgi:hypothetical protein